MKTAKKCFRIEADSEAFILVLVLNHRNVLDLSGFEVENVILFIPILGSTAENIVAYAIIRCWQHLIRF